MLPSCMFCSECLFFSMLAVGGNCSHDEEWVGFGKGANWQHILHIGNLP